MTTETRRAYSRLSLPPILYAVAGHSASLYFSSLVDWPYPDNLTFECECEIGSASAEVWTATPSASQAGDYPLSLSVTDSTTNARFEARTLVRVSPQVSDLSVPIKLLMVGDSLTHASLYPRAVRELLIAAGNTEPLFLGTHKPQQAGPGIAHEGYGGWTWERFVSYYEPDAAQPPHRATSPFVFVNGDSTPLLDVDRYFAQAGGMLPDFITVFLGINDCFLAKHWDVADIEDKIDSVFGFADALVNAFRATAPDAEIGLVLTPVCNGRDKPFDDEYAEEFKGEITRPGWVKIRHRLVQRQIEHFGARESEGMFLIPTPGLDPMNGYPVDNSVHPNEDGYRQLGADIYAWLNWRLVEKQTS